ncbi:MAG: hypothetical protein FWG66_04300 [Spirochaetes bacterium]|nr:hypothetical protein [Spirochaetota bacterium]
MDARKKQINILEDGKLKSLSSLNLALEGFGERLFGRMESGGPGHDTYGDVADYFRLQKDIADTNLAIAAVEEQNRLQKELEEQIEGIELENKEREKELAAAFRKMGKALLEDNSGAYTEVTAPFREQADTLIAKIENLESRCAGVEQKDGNNVFLWIGKSAQGLVLRSFLGKTQESFERLCRNVGEAYSRVEGFEENNASSEIASNAWEAAQIREQIKALSEEKDRLKGEKGKIDSVFSAEGSPVKQVQNFKNHILQVKDSLRALYLTLGMQAALPDYVEGLDPDRKEFVSALVSADDDETIAGALALKQSILDAEDSIRKLRAALAIDDEREKINKHRKSIADKKLKIAQAEKDIGELEAEIKDAESSIEELQKLL